jgi:RNA binding exosome subunit
MEQPSVVLSKPTLWIQSRLEEDGEYLHFGKQRAIIRKGRVIACEEDPYAQIKVEELWSLVSDL